MTQSKRPKGRKCQKCGKVSRTKGNICLNKECGEILPPFITRGVTNEQDTDTAPAVVNTKGGNTMNTILKIIGSIVLTIAGLVLLVLLLNLVGCNFNKAVTTETTTPTPTVTIAATTAPIAIPTAPAETTTAAPVTPTETALTSIGIDQPSKSWFLASAGTLISGDVAIFDNDNNSKKTPVYDSAEGTADVIYLTQDTYVWAEWGCHMIENANAQDVANVINDKLTNGNFDSVRYFNGYSKLGTNTPTIISGKVDPSSITLPAIATK